MKPPSQPNSDYTRTWSPPGVIEYATLADGSRLRYLKTGYGPTPLILLHTVRTQLDHFQLVIPRLLHAFTVYAIDMPGMGWSDIVPGASYTEPALRRALVQFVTALDLVGLTLAGESMGATVSLTASIELEDRVRSVKGAFIPIGGVTSGFPSRLVWPGPEPEDELGGPRDPRGFRDTAPS